MQANLDASSLKVFTKALTCLSRYGEELAIYAHPDALSFSATNSSKSAYCRFKYDKQFFSRYRVGLSVNDLNDIEEIPSVTGQLLAKSILSILRHRTVEKSVERCEMSIIEGSETGVGDDDEEDSLESRLILRLHCKHGVVKTHRLVLNTALTLMAPGVPDSSDESRLTIGPKALRDLIDHFPTSKSAKADPQLVWTFGDTEVGLKTLESSIDSRGKGQLTTELTISAEEFEGYEMSTTPMTIAFHLREFSATIAFADSMSLDLDLRFTTPSAPLFIDLGADSTEILFVISTSQVHGTSTGSQYATNTVNSKKRELEGARDTPRIKKPMKAAQPMDLDVQPNRSTTISRSVSRAPGSMPPPAIIPRASSTQRGWSPDRGSGGKTTNEPLFLPSSQASVVDEEALRALGMDAANECELVNLLEDEGEEVDFTSMSQPLVGNSGNAGLSILGDYDYMDVHDSLDLVDEGEPIATQSNSTSEKSFQPLFED